MWRYVHTDEMYHHGIPGQKWGIRRYQNKDGSLTPAGRRRAKKLENEYTKLTGKKMKRNPDEKENDKKVGNKKQSIKKTVSEMSDADLKNRLTRLENEKRLVQLENERVSTGQKILSTIGKDVIKPSLIDAGKNALTAYLSQAGKEALGVEAKKDAKKSKLKQEHERLKMEKEILDYKKKIDDYNKAQKKMQEEAETLEDDILNLMDNGRRAFSDDIRFRKKK